MAANEQDSAPLSGPSRPRFGRAWVFAGRIAVAGCVVALGIWALAGLSLLTSQPKVSNNPPAKGPAGNTPAADWPVLLPLAGGGWTIAGLPWQLSVKRMPRMDAEAQLLKPPPEPPGALPLAKSDEREKDLMTLVKAIGATRRAEKDHVVYILSLTDVRVALFTTGEGESERLTHGRVVCGGGDVPAFLIDAAPVPAELAAAMKTPDLLPMPPGYRRVATRRSVDGTPIADLLVVDARGPALREFWQQQGYRTEAVEHGGTLRGVACWKDGKAVQAWLWPTAGNADRTLVLQVAMAAEGTK